MAPSGGGLGLRNRQDDLGLLARHEVADRDDRPGAPRLDPVRCVKARTETPSGAVTSSRTLILGVALAF